MGREFGNLADMRASDPVTLAKVAKNYNKNRRNTSYEENNDPGQSRKSKIEIKDENYFNRHFAHTPTA